MNRLKHQKLILLCCLIYIFLTILPCFFFFFLIIDLYFLIPEILVHICYPVSELVIPIGTTSKEAKAEIEIDPVIAEAKIRNC